MSSHDFSFPTFPTSLTNSTDCVWNKGVHTVLRPYPSTVARRRIGSGAALAAALSLAAGIGIPATAGAATGPVNLVAYSTPKPAYAALIKAFNATSAGKSVTFSQSFGASGSQATAVVNGLPADVVNFSLAPDMNKLVKAGIVSPAVERHPYPGDGHQLDRLLRGPQGESQAHHQLGQPGAVRRPGHHAQPVQLGQRQVEPDGRLWGPAQAMGKNKAQATAYLTKLLKNTVAQPSSASAAPADLRVRRGRRPARLRGRRPLRAEEGRGHLHRHPAPDHPDPEPHRHLDEGHEPGGGQGVRGLPAVAGRPEGLGRAGLPSGAAEVAAQFKFPKPKTLFTIDSLGGWTKVNTVFFTPSTGVVAKIEQGLGVSTSSS